MRHLILTTERRTKAGWSNLSHLKAFTLSFLENCPRTCQKTFQCPLHLSASYILQTRRYIVISCSSFIEWVRVFVRGRESLAAKKQGKQPFCFNGVGLWTNLCGNAVWKMGLKSQWRSHQLLLWKSYRTVSSEENQFFPRTHLLDEQDTKACV